jgi:hypothetical protein
MDEKGRDERNSLGVEPATIARWQAQGFMGRPLGPAPSPRLLAALEGLAALAKVRSAGTAGPWFYNSYAAVFSAPLVQIADDWPLDGEDIAEPRRYYHEAEPLVASVPPLVGDSAHGRHAADAEFIAAAGSFDFAGLLAELTTLFAGSERARRLDAVRVHEGDPGVRLPFFDVATLLSTNDPGGLEPGPSPAGRPRLRPLRARLAGRAQKLGSARFGRSRGDDAEQPDESRLP